ncbi:hypothetical protein TNCV_839201 [Trichonephila clavipes]|nr:hypothetical protein TNCV_839201 [Trichonephila clavipes]
MGSQPESIITLPASNQRAASKLSAMPKNLNITHPDEARLPRLPDSIDQPITAMPQSRIEHIFGGDQGYTPEIMDEILTTARDLELEVNEEDIEELIMGHEDELTTEQLQEILNEEHQETQ